MTGVQARSVQKANALREMAARGMSLKEAHAEIGGSYGGLCNFCQRHEIKFVHDLAKRAAEANAGRVDAMVSMYRSGATLQQIGDTFGLTRERVRQLMTKHEGIRRTDGGQHAVAKQRRLERARVRDARCQRKYGCSWGQLNKIRLVGKRHMARGGSWETTPMGAFNSQRGNARSRGIEWSLLLWDWWDIWQQAGKWSQRGRARDAYVMCRIGDVGPYARGNVYIATLAHNATVQPNNPYRLGHPDHEKVMAGVRRKSVSRNRSVDLHIKNKGLPRGVTLHKGRYIAQATMRGKNTYLGSFSTPEQAAAAYLSATCGAQAEAA